jgi:hypothetical protein
MVQLTVFPLYARKIKEQGCHNTQNQHQYEPLQDEMTVPYNNLSVGNLILASRSRQ